MIFHFCLLPFATAPTGYPPDEHTACQFEADSYKLAGLNARIYNVFLLSNQADYSFHKDRNLAGIPLVRNRGPE